jgi:hypothetical protein
VVSQWDCTEALNLAVSNHIKPYVTDSQLSVEGLTLAIKAPEAGSLRYRAVLVPTLGVIRIPNITYLMSIIEKLEQAQGGKYCRERPSQLCARIAQRSVLAGKALRGSKAVSIC